MKAVMIVLISFGSLCTGVAVVTQNGASVQEPGQDQTGPFMRAKLVASQRVLDGLVTEDFGLIYHGAANMKKISHAVNWPQADDEVYQHYGTEFRRQCDKLMHLSEEKNLEGAHFTYLNMTTTCVDCHNYVRSSFRIERNDDPQGPVRLIPTEWDGPVYQPNRQTNPHLKRDD